MNDVCISSKQAQKPLYYWYINISIFAEKNAFQFIIIENDSVVLHIRPFVVVAAAAVVVAVDSYYLVLWKVEQSIGDFAFASVNKKVFKKKTRKELETK